MRVRCPHCRSPLEIIPEASIAAVICPSCGSSLDGVNETLISIKPDRRLLGRFELIERVGQGYFGEVWRARDTDLRRTVAIKIPRTQDLTEEYRERFLREAKTTAQLRHPNIVPVHEVGRDEGTMFIVSDFIDGMTLAERIINNRPDPRESAELCATLALALHHAHEAGVVHRDLKPSNVMLDRTNKPYLLDFGLAKQDAGEFSMTATGDILGTPAYMSPEQARGESHLADRRSDIYSLGVVLYELLTGQRPFKGSTHMLLRAIQQIEPSPPSKLNRQLPRDLETICLKAMSKEPHRRYATALEMAEDLQRFLHDESILARRPSTIERGMRWIRRNPIVSVTSAIALFAILGMIGAIWARPPAVVVIRQKVRIETSPVKATVVFYPLSPKTGEPVFERAVRPKPATQVEADLEPGEYLVVAVPDNNEFLFHEVFRTVPAPDSGLGGMLPHLAWERNNDGTVELPKITLPPRSILDSMVPLSGAESASIGDDMLPESPKHRRAIPSFLLAETETTVAQLMSAREAAGLAQVKPLFMRLMKTDAPLPNLPVAFVSYDDAVLAVELMGQRLLDLPKFCVRWVKSGTDGLTRDRFLRIRPQAWGIGGGGH